MLKSMKLSVLASFALLLFSSSLRASDVDAVLNWMPQMLEQHPSVRSAEQQIQAAVQELDAARWQYFPTPSVGAESSNQTNTLLDSKIRFARLQQPLWTGGRLTAQSERANAQLEFARATWREQRHSLASRWLELWGEAAAAKLRIDAFEQSEQQHLRYVQLVRSRAREGQIARTEEQLSIARLASVQADLEQARTQYRQGMSKLKQMLGTASSFDIEPTLSQLSLLQSEPKTLELLQAHAQETHPLLQKSLAQIQIAKADADLARSRLAPEVYVRAEIMHGDITGETRKTYVGFSTSLGGGLSNLNAVASAQSRVLAQEQELEARRKDLFDLLASDQLQQQSQILRYQQLQHALAAADAYLQSSETQFSAGRRSWQELMNSAREKAQLLAQLADTGAQAWLTRERLKLNTIGLDAYLLKNPS